jgi:hypothetical protein
VRLAADVDENFNCSLPALMSLIDVGCRSSTAQAVKHAAPLPLRRRRLRWQQRSSSSKQQQYDKMECMRLSC